MPDPRHLQQVPGFSLGCEKSYIGLTPFGFAGLYISMRLFTVNRLNAFLFHFILFMYVVLCLTGPVGR